jgi:hypothetical protein
MSALHPCKMEIDKSQVFARRVLGPKLNEEAWMQLDRITIELVLQNSLRTSEPFRQRIRE